MTTVNAAATRSIPLQLVLRAVAWPEAIALLLFPVALFVGAQSHPSFLDAGFLLSSTSEYMEVGLIALAMTLIIISGSIDLSVASNLALTGVLCGTLYNTFKVPMAVVVGLAPVIGALLGAVNGLLITRLRLPSLTVTLATLALYRGLAQVLAGDYSIGGFPSWFTGLDYVSVGPFPAPLLIFLAAAGAVALLLHCTTFGRAVYAIGFNEEASRFSALAVDRTKLLLFTLSGAAAGTGAMMMISRLGVARYDLARGEELSAITAVVLGGASIFGGRGTIFGTVVALLLLGVIRRAMGMANLQPGSQLIVTGVLLVAAVLLSRLGGWLAAVRKGRGGRAAE